MGGFCSEGCNGVDLQKLFVNVEREGGRQMQLVIHASIAWMATTSYTN